MKMSFERSHKSAEGVREKKKDPWDMSGIEFRRRVASDARDFKKIIDSFPTDVDPEIEAAARAAAEEHSEMLEAEKAREKEAELDRLREQVVRSYDSPRLPHKDLDMQGDPEGTSTKRLLRSNNGQNNSLNTVDEDDAELDDYLDNLEFQNLMKRTDGIADFGKSANSTPDIVSEPSLLFDKNQTEKTPVVTPQEAEPSPKYHPSPFEVSFEEWDKYSKIWEDETRNADRRGVNPETGLYEKGRTPVDEADRENYNKLKATADKLASGAELTLGEKMAGRDSVIYEWGDYQLKPDCCYRKINQRTLEEYQKSGFVVNDPNNFKGRRDTIDWYLGATTPRYGDILIEVPARAEYFVPANKPGHTMSGDPDALHMHSSGLIDPIPMSEVKVLGRAPEVPQSSSEPQPEQRPQPEQQSQLEEEPQSKFKGEYEETIKFEGQKSVENLKQIYANLGSATSEQIEKFKSLYNDLSAIGKTVPNSPKEEQQKLNRLFDIRDEIHRLQSDIATNQGHSLSQQ